MHIVLSLCFFSGSLKAHHLSVRELYDLKDGAPLFRACMSEKRFEQLKSCLRFDDSARRDRSDKAAPDRSVIGKFNDRMSQIYTPTEHLTIDEMLVEFHGRVSFRQYIPSKPGKFGLKLFWVAEAESAIPLKCLLYIGESMLSAAEKEEHGGHVPVKKMFSSRIQAEFGNSV